MGVMRCFAGFLVFMLSTPALADRHEAPKPCLHPERASITDEERNSAQDAIDIAAARMKSPIVIMPLVISRSWPGGLREPGDGPHPKFLYRWIGRDLKPVADPKDLSKVWGVHIDVPLAALAEGTKVFIAALSDILKFHDNNRSIELILASWFPKEQRDALIRDRAALSRLVTRHLITTACIEALVARGTPGNDRLAFGIIRNSGNPEWANRLGEVFRRDILRPPESFPSSKIKWWTGPFLSVGAADPGEREISWLGSADPDLRATAALLLGEASYREGFTEDFARRWIARLLPLSSDPSLQVRREALVAITRLAAVARIPLETFGIDFGDDAVAEALLEAAFYCPALDARTRVRPCATLSAILDAQPDITAVALAADRGGPDRACVAQCQADHR